MLARIAESLYWMGRNIERSEHCNRFLRVHFTSMLDAPMADNRDFTLRSILFMFGSNAQNEQIAEKYVWQEILFDANNSSSMVSLSRIARENARSIRNTISTEAWEAINKWYLYQTNFPHTAFQSENLQQYCEETALQLALIKANIYNTMLHNDLWHVISVGVFFERAHQVLRILRSKISDWTILSEDGANKILLRYQWNILLKSLEGFDIHNSLFRGLTTQANIFNLILGNSLFPRSVEHSLMRVKEHVESISVVPQDYDLVLKDITTLLEDVESFDSYDVIDQVIDHIEYLQKSVADLHFDINKIYFQ